MPMERGVFLGFLHEALASSHESAGLLGLVS